MRCLSWLSLVKDRLALTKRRQRSTRQLRTMEPLEARVLLSVSALMIGTELSITASAADSVTVRENPATPGKVQVLGNGATVAIVSTNARSLSAINITGSDSNNTINLSGVTAAVFSNPLLKISVSGGDGNDAITGSPDVSNSLIGGDGADTLNGGSQADTLDGSNGDDSINGGDGNDSILGRDGADRLNGDGGNDTILGGDGSDIINGGDGDDSILAGNGADSVSGGFGNDIVSGDSGNDTLRGDDGDDSILGGTENDSIDGSDGNDTLDGQDGNDTVQGSAGTDSLLGGVGADSLHGGDGDDVVNGQAGNDTIEGGLGSDLLFGGSDNDTIFDDFRNLNNSGSGNDTLLGQAGNDTLIAASGSDSLDGGTGNDLLDTRSSTVSIANATLMEGNSGLTNMVFTVTLSSASSLPITMNYATSSNGTIAGGTATGGLAATPNADYVTSSGQVTFNPGELTKTFSVAIVGDTRDESDAETFFVTLSNLSNARAGNLVSEGRIFDDDATPPPPVLDIFFLLDDTGSFQGALTTTIRQAITSMIAQLGALYPTGDLAYGIGRFEDYNGTGGANTDHPFILNQPVITSTTPQFGAAIDAALRRSAPGGGGDLPESMLEGLAQVATGRGFDGNNDGDSVDSGVAGLSASQTNANGSDVPAYSSFSPDLTGDSRGPILPPTAPVATATDGVGFRAGARHIVIVATDAGTAYQPDGATVYTGVGGVTVSAATMTAGGRATTPQGRGASFQTTINQMIAQNIEVVSLGNEVFGGGALRAELTGLATLTGSINRSSTALENNITPGVSADDIQPGQSLYFRIDPNDPTGLAASLVSGIAGAAGDPPPSPPPAPPPVLPPAGVENDTLLGGDGNDTLLAGESNDFLNGDAGFDLIDGGDGDDALLGGSEGDTLSGGNGNDTIDGQGGNDSVNGGAGDDNLIWNGIGDGIDTLTSNAGGDTVTINGTAAVNTFIVGKTADSQLRISEGTASIIVSSLVTNIVLNTGNGNDTVTINDLSGVSPAVVTVNGDAGNDVLNASTATLGGIRLALNGGDGNDSITGSLGDDTIDGGDGNDTLIGGTGNDTLIGGTGSDRINGGAGNDRELGGDGSDTVVGGDGNDTLSGDAGNDSLDGGNNDDVLTGDADNDTLTGGAGNDSLLGGTGLDVLSGGLGNDTCDGGLNDDIINGNEGDDKLRGNDGNDSITGDIGNDELNGGDGNDTLVGGDGNDGLFGGDGADVLNGGAGNDSILGGDGNDFLYGGAGNDLLLGQDGDDRIDGQGAADTIAGGQGTNTLIINGDFVNESFVITSALLEAMDGI